MKPDTGTLYNARRWQDGSFMVGINSCAKLSWGDPRSQSKSVLIFSPSLRRAVVAELQCGSLPSIAGARSHYTIPTLTS
jgi:hypothetical protein